ncbi:glycosyltransferase, partial [Neobacillus drentensis]|uniref:glycosyltransferase family 2 protein n=1 Tax=Neobacillus drentensis TaxID=220684 RepID=UPI002FFDA39E
MNNDPTISVIMSVYNTPEIYLKEAIDSILCQTFSDFEFIIIDDFSTMDIRNIIFGYNDHRIVYLKNNENKGLAWSLNRGIRISKGRYIARMDADDISLPHRFEKQVIYMENTNTDVLSTHVRFLGSLEGETKGSWDSDRIKANLIFENKPIIHPTVMIRKDFLIRNKLEYNEDFKKAQDYELWSRVVNIGSFKLLNDVLLLYRIHPNQASTKGKNEQNNYAEKVRLNLLKSVCPDIEIDSLSHNLLSTLEVSEDIIRLCSWCKLLILSNK